MASEFGTMKTLTLVLMGLAIGLTFALCPEKAFYKTKLGSSVEGSVGTSRVAANLRKCALRSVNSKGGFHPGSGRLELFQEEKLRFSGSIF